MAVSATATDFLVIQHKSIGPGSVILTKQIMKEMAGQDLFGRYGQITRVDFLKTGVNAAFLQVDHSFNDRYIYNAIYYGGGREREGGDKKNRKMVKTASKTG